MLLWNLNFPSLIFSQNETHCSLKFNNAKRKVLHLGQSNPQHKHRVSIKWIEGHPEEKTGGCWLARNFTWAGGMHLQPRKPSGLIQKYGQPVKPVWKKGINFLAGSFAIRIRGNGFGFFFKKRKGWFTLDFTKMFFTMRVVKCWTGCPERWWMLHRAVCSRSGRTELWAAWSSCRCPCPL